MTSRFSPGDLVALGAVSVTGAALSASLAWAHMSAYGAVCGSGLGLLVHCPACCAAAGLMVLGLASLALAQATRLRAPPVKARAGRGATR